MKTESQLSIPEPKPLATRQPSVADILSAAVQGGVTQENVAVVKELLAIRKEEMQAAARADFARDFTELQAGCQRVKASKIVPGNREGEVRYRYAPYEKVMEEVAPLLKEYHFAVTFDTKLSEGRVTAICTLIHASGHERSNEFTCRIGKGPPASSEAQGDGAAFTYAKRFALCAALNIVVETDNDARAEGDTGKITKTQAEELRKRCVATNSDIVRFLKFAGNVETFDDIPVSKYGQLDTFLRKKEGAAATEMHPDDQKF